MEGIDAFFEKFHLAPSDFTFIHYDVKRKLFKLFRRCKSDNEFRHFKARVSEFSDFEMERMYESDCFSFVSYVVEMYGFEFKVYVERWRLLRGCDKEGGEEESD